MRRSAEHQELKLFPTRSGGMSPRDRQDLMSWPFSEVKLTAESLGLSLTAPLDGGSSRVAVGSGRGLSRSPVLTVAP
jgi:hypothetical protein